jgi:putative oxygen-independent coproporphyrinogen III oxidase
LQRTRDTVPVPRLPDGQTAPVDGALPLPALSGLADTPLGLYVHVPFCAARCGYCDFNTYVPGGDGEDEFAAYVRAALAEIRLARRVLGPAAPRLGTVFFGGGTPTLLPPDLLAALLDEIRDAFGLSDGAEVTTEANPETVSPAMLGVLRAAGFTRISLGMQSAAPHVLAALDRRHTPGRAVAAAAQAREAGFEHVSLDLIYGTPGETEADWDASLRAALDAGVDHLSAYGLTVEPGTRLHARVRAASTRAPDDDSLAARYRAADALLDDAGLRWYEISNWARDDASRCRHNVGYWRSANWWGIGPGAHSHVGGVRWWNVLLPRAYAARLADGESPAAGREELGAAERRMERIMLEVRLAEGLALGGDDAAAWMAARREAASGRLDAGALRDGRAVLTLDGRLLGDAVALALVG